MMRAHLSALHSIAGPIAAVLTVAILSQFLCLFHSASFFRHLLSASLTLELALPNARDCTAERSA